MRELTLTSNSTIPLKNIKQEMDRLFDELIPYNWRNTNSGTVNGEWAPFADLYETDNKYICEIDLPGLTENDIEISAQNNMITISGERESREKESNLGHLRKERLFGKFKRSFMFPATIKDDKVTASFKEGVLLIEIPKAEKSKRKPVPIN